MVTLQDRQLFISLKPRQAVSILDTSNINVIPVSAFPKPAANPKKRAAVVSSDQEDFFGSSPVKNTNRPKKLKVYSSDEDSDDMKVCSGSFLIELLWLCSWSVICRHQQLVVWCLWSALSIELISLWSVWAGAPSFERFARKCDLDVVRWLLVETGSWLLRCFWIMFT